MNIDIPFTIEQVSRVTEIPKPTLRFWESQFSEILIVDRTEGNQREYSKDNIKMIIKIKKMLRDEGYTLMGVRKKLGWPYEK